jgi:hypothetical protein
MPSEKKKIRNQEIYMLVASGTPKEHVCARFHLSLSQLNKILKESCEEADQWFQSLPRQTMIQIFRFNSEKIFGEIQILEQLRNQEKEPAKQFEMTKGIINAYSQYTKLVAEGPSLIRQKEVADAAAKIVEKK